MPCLPDKRCFAAQDNQRALANLSRKVALASGPWKEVAVLLADGYARSAKGAF